MKNRGKLILIVVFLLINLLLIKNVSAEMNLTGASTDESSYSNGSIVTFNVDWVDANNASYDQRLLISNSSKFTNCNFSETNYCLASTLITITTSPISVAMTATKNTKWYAQICNNSECSSRRQRLNIGIDVNVSLAANASWHGSSTWQRLGSTVAVGDINGDKYEDAVISGQGYNNIREFYVKFGSKSGWNQKDVNITTDIDASFYGEVSSVDYIENVGVSDINGDGYGDILAGSRWYFNSIATQVGKVYVIFGRASGWKKNVNITAEANMSFYGERSGDRTGNVNSIGDVNGDGYNDIIVVSARNDQYGTNAGKAYIIFGSGSGWQTDVNITTIANASFYGEGPNNGLSEGNYNSGIINFGDFNNDGLSDILIGVSESDYAGTDNGKLYVIFGKTSGWQTDVNISTIANASYYGEGTGDYFGYTAGVGDVNGDGIDDILTSSLFNDYGGTKAGKMHIIFGRTTGWATNMNISNSSLGENASYYGEFPGNYTGTYISSKDLDGDNIDDIVVTNFAWNYNDVKNYGKVWIILGKTSGWQLNVNFSTVGNASVIGEVRNKSQLGLSAEIGDINGDGYNDVLVGANSLGTPVIYNGKAYVLFMTEGNNAGIFQVTPATVSPGGPSRGGINLVKEEPLTDYMITKSGEIIVLRLNELKSILIDNVNTYELKFLKVENGLVTVSIGDILALINVNEVIKLDFDRDNVYDLELELASFYDDTINLIIKRIFEPVFSKEVIEKVAFASEKEDLEFVQDNLAHPFIGLLLMSLMLYFGYIYYKLEIKVV